MKLVDTEETIVLVTGSSITSEERDRPLAYRLKSEIDGRGIGHAYRRAVVVADLWYLDNRTFHLNPTIAIGGPGANGVTQEFSAFLPTAHSVDERVFVQLDFQGDLKRAALWGANAAGTAEAVEAFIGRGYLDDLLGRIWRFRAGIFV
ncbi:MAG TPA: hypothetical protein VIG08_05440 [Gemmatimonadales bacterium]|jgi:hypothetical protein